MQITDIYKKVSELLAASEKHYHHSLPAVMRQVLIVDFTNLIKETQGLSQDDGRKGALAELKTNFLGRFQNGSI